MIKTLFLCAVLIVTMASARQAQAASTQVVVSVSWQIQDGRRQAFQAIAQEMVELAGKEPGTLGFEWYMSADGKRCQLIETYEDADALVTHLLGPVLKVGAPKLLTMSSISGVQVYGEPGAKAREILAQFKPKIFSHTLGLNEEIPCRRCGQP